MSDVVRTASALASRPSRTWQLRPWPNDPTTVLLVFVDHMTVPTASELDDALAEARRAGARNVRTSALFPRAAGVALERGFVAIDTLCLLRLALDSRLDRALDERSDPRAPVTRPMRRWHQEAAARLDQEAFGATWGNDAASIADIRTATPHHRARMVGDRNRMIGFALSGCGGASGYLQRIAVGEADRRRGVARALVVDALRWMRRRPLNAAYVNTGFDNAAALALYEDFGFARMDDRLTIVERRLPV